jgi:uncharacterized protein
MKIAKMLVIAALISPLCRADDEGISLADKLLDLTGSQASMQKTFEAGLKPSLDQMKTRGAPDELVNAIHTEAQGFFQENFNWDAMKPKIAQLYVDNFTNAELRDIIAFYETPTGRKTIIKLPELMQKTIVMSMTGVQANMPEFQRRVGALIQDYQKKAQAAAAASAAPAPAPSSAAAPATVTVPTEPPK